MNLRRAADQYESAAVEFLRAVELVTDENLDRHVEGGWSARQVVHHVADSEAQSYARLRRLLAEPPGSVVQGYDEAAWAECDTLSYRDLPIEQSLSEFAAVRAASLDIVRRLKPEGLERYGGALRVGSLHRGHVARRLHPSSARARRAAARGDTRLAR